MASEIQGGRPRLTPLKTTKSGALTAGGGPFVFDPQSDADYRPYLGTGFAAVQITSPIAAAPADLRVVLGDQEFPVAGGGNVLTIPGPVSSLKIFALTNNVAGSGIDDVRLTPLGVLKTGY